MSSSFQILPPLSFIFHSVHVTNNIHTHSKPLDLLPFCHSFLSLLLRRSVLCIFNNFLRWHLKRAQVTAVHLRPDPLHILRQPNR